MSLCTVGHIPLQAQIECTMDYHTSLICVVDGNLTNKRAPSVSAHMKMQRVSSNNTLLAHVGELNPNNFLRMASLEYHHVPSCAGSTMNKVSYVKGDKKKEAFFHKRKKVKGEEGMGKKTLRMLS